MFCKMMTLYKKNLQFWALLASLFVGVKNKRPKQKSRPWRGFKVNFHRNLSSYSGKSPVNMQGNFPKAIALNLHCSGIFRQLKYNIMLWKWISKGTTLPSVCSTLNNSIVNWVFQICQIYFFSLCGEIFLCFPRFPNLSSTFCMVLKPVLQILHES